MILTKCQDLKLYKIQIILTKVDVVDNDNRHYVCFVSLSETFIKNRRKKKPAPGIKSNQIFKYFFWGNGNGRNFLHLK